MRMCIFDFEDSIDVHNYDLIKREQFSENKDKEVTDNASEIQIRTVNTKIKINKDDVRNSLIQQKEKKLHCFCDADWPCMYNSLCY